jgi:hypothetical protein
MSCMSLAICTHCAPLQGSIAHRILSSGELVRHNSLVPHGVVLCGRHGAGGMSNCGDGLRLVRSEVEGQAGPEVGGQCSRPFRAPARCSCNFSLGASCDRRDRDNNERIPHLCRHPTPKPVIWDSPSGTWRIPSTKAHRAPDMARLLRMRPTPPTYTLALPSPICMERTTSRRSRGNTGLRLRRRQKRGQKSSRKSFGMSWRRSTSPIHRYSCWRTYSCSRDICGQASLKMHQTITTCYWRSWLTSRGGRIWRLGVRSCLHQHPPYTY